MRGWRPKEVGGLNCDRQLGDSMVVFLGVQWMSEWYRSRAARPKGAGGGQEG